MRILITGANGFIAQEIIARLVTAGHEIIACVHDKLLENIPHTRVFKADFTKAIMPEFWSQQLKDVDAVINCVGVFQTTKEKTMWNIHYEAPKALFEACVKQGIKKIIQISALGIDKVNVPYATSKLAIDHYLQSLDIDSTIIRPGLVYGKGTYGGSSLFRGLAGLPYILPIPSHSEQLQQPIHMDDLTLIVEKALTLPGRKILCAVGEERISIKNLLIKIRTWLGFKKAWPFVVPDIFIQLGAKIGNYIPNSPMSETGIKMMSVNNIASEVEIKNLENSTHIKPRSFTSGLNGMVSSVQDRWHARLYFLRPLLRISIAFIWIFSGIVSLLPTSSSLSFDLMTQAKIPLTFQPLALYSLSMIDILLGIATLFNYRLLAIGFLQCIFILLYTVIISFSLTIYWLNPFAPIAKNIPLFVAILIMMALESKR
ncbi:SDR family oxidoreductase [Legionella sp.]|uniref:SDR family oxidoreductase n=1 Tax=Legionella sp. TaxID=459 RepID=UPI003C896470